MEVEYPVSVLSLVLLVRLYKFLLYIGDGSTALKSLSVLNGKVVTSISSGHLYVIYVQVDDGESDFRYTTLLYYYGGNTTDCSTMGALTSGYSAIVYGNFYLRFAENINSTWLTVTQAFGTEYSYGTTIYQLF